MYITEGFEIPQVYEHRDYSYEQDVSLMMN